MSVSVAAPKQSSQVDAVEGSLYSFLKGGSKALVDSAVDGYLAKQNVKPEEYELRVNNLRNLFSTPEKLQELKNQSTTGHQPYKPLAAGWSR